MGKPKVFSGLKLSQKFQKTVKNSKILIAGWNFCVYLLKTIQK